MSAAAIAVLLAALQAPAGPGQAASAPAQIGGIEVRGNHTTPGRYGSPARRHQAG
jgi:hypothetical protein